LSNICRFAGHVKTFYSVAQHSVECAKQAPNNHIAKLCLFHDAHEAYTGDVPNPIKRVVDMDGIAFMLDIAIGRALDLYPTVEDMQIVSEIDLRMLATEIESPLIRGHKLDWNLKVEPYLHQITPLSPQESLKTFLDLYRNLS
jgi:uncharacterized protein